MRCLGSFAVFGDEVGPLRRVATLDLRFDPLDEATNGVLALGDPAAVHGDLVGTADALAGALLVRLDVAGGFIERVEGTGVEPAVLVADQADFQLAQIQVGLVDAGDFDFSSRARLNALCDLDDAVVVGVQADDGVVAGRVLGLLDD